VASAFWPWIYLAFGVQMAIAYNSAIVSVRHFNLYDSFFQHMDAALFHISVANISHAAARFYGPAEIVYYSIGGVMGAALLFLCVAGDRRAAFQMAGAITTAYYISLALFLAWPSHGPYALNPTDFPHGMATDVIQRASYQSASALYHHRQWVSPALGYFVSFPSMHVSQPFIVAWFLRRWRRVSLLIYGYCVLLALAIVVLQWHYLVDIFGGLAISMLAIKMVSMSPASTPPQQKQSV
jgi:hypothetical protein